MIMIIEKEDVTSFPAPNPRSSTVREGRRGRGGGGGGGPSGFRNLSKQHGGSANAPVPVRTFRRF